MICRARNLFGNNGSTLRLTIQFGGRMRVALIALLICLGASAAIAEADLPSAPAGQASATPAAATRSARSRAKKVAKPRKQRIDRNRGAMARPGRP